ncbi:MAG: DUF1830 domain-containing protein [Pleurocapsa sp. MO_226.B13]|nr:DUF1830 domain-containing protein [Pleurocapsa sp. MO_226.B13]
MAQILDPLPNDENTHILCCYVNATSQIQVARITNIPNWYFERVVFPGQRLVFEAEPHAVLEIHSGMMASAILSDTILCERLAINPINPEQSDRQTQEAKVRAIQANKSNNSAGKNAVSSLNVAV